MLSGGKRAAPGNRDNRRQDQSTESIREKGNTAMSQDMALILAKARNSDTVKALSAGSAAQQAMAAAADMDSFSAAASALSAAFDTIKAEFLASNPHLAHAVSTHQAKLTGRA